MESGLEAHHLRGVHENPETTLDPNNGVALCRKCHIAFHVKYGRRGGFSEEDAREFIEGPAGDILWLVTRWRAKGGVADLEKAKHYIELLIALESGATMTSTSTN